VWLYQVLFLSVRAQDIVDSFILKKAQDIVDTLHRGPH
jgi:hypothetical protein